MLRGCFLDQFYFVAFWGINEGKSATVFLQMWPIRVFNAMGLDVFFEFIETFNPKW